MASLQKKGDSWYCQFMHRGQRHTFTIGKFDETESHNKSTLKVYTASGGNPGWLALKVKVNC
jgi:hypothetical protein